MHRSRRTTKKRGDRKDLFWKNCLFQLGRELQLECLIRKTFLELVGPILFFSFLFFKPIISRQNPFT
jgi:hypothetical protein